MLWNKINVNIKQGIFIVLLLLSEYSFSNVVFLEIDNSVVIKKDKLELLKEPKKLTVEGYQNQYYVYGSVTLGIDNKIEGYVYSDIPAEKTNKELNLSSSKENLIGKIIFKGSKNDNYEIYSTNNKEENKINIVYIYGFRKNSEVTAYDLEGNLYQLIVKD